MHSETTIRLHRFLPTSQVNGPGMRAVVWVQGCALGCPGCFNQETHDFDSGEILPVEMLVQQILALQNRLEGITISGGEPAHQHRALALLIEQVRAQSRLSVVVFSGYTLDELKRIPRISDFLANIDVLIAGRYQAEQRVARGLIGSANKTIHYFSGRYTEKDFEDIPQAEILIAPDGRITLSGIDPLRWEENGKNG